MVKMPRWITGQGNGINLTIAFDQTGILTLASIQQINSFLKLFFLGLINLMDQRL